MVTDCVCACGDKKLHAGTVSFGLYLRRLQESMHLLVFFGSLSLSLGAHGAMQRDDQGWQAMFDHQH